VVHLSKEEWTDALCCGQREQLQCRDADRFRSASLATEGHPHVEFSLRVVTVMHSQSISSLLSRCRHSRWCGSHFESTPTSTFLRSLRSRPVTALLRYYGRSDSCPALSATRQVSLIHARGLRPGQQVPERWAAPGQAGREQHRPARVIARESAQAPAGSSPAPTPRTSTPH
jgi:hypothetical protein